MSDLLSRSLMGRVRLHLTCAARGRNLRWHLAGAWRERKFFGVR